MKPALSVILFTVLSGAGLGALAVVGLAELAMRVLGSSLTWSPALTVMTAVALLLVVGGFCASTLHLANPRNAWRSLARWRTSWLSREALGALVLMPVAFGYIVLHAMRAAAAATLAVAVVLDTTAWVLLYCTAMIYASLKPIRQWHTLRVPLVLALLAHASGSLLVVCAQAASATDVAGWSVAALLLFVAALVVKLEYWRFVGDASGGVTLARALGVPQGVGPPSSNGGATVASRLLDAGHSKRTFLTDEFVNTPASATRRWMRISAVLAGFVVPLGWLAYGAASVKNVHDAAPDWRMGAAAFVAFVACLAGLTAERWLFFAEARHTVRLYHGEATT